MTTIDATSRRKLSTSSMVKQKKKSSLSLSGSGDNSIEVTSSSDQETSATASAAGEMKEISRKNDDKSKNKEKSITTNNNSPRTEKEKESLNSNSVHNSHSSIGSGGGRIDSEVVKQLREKVDVLQSDVARRQESYIRRERAYKQRIEELELQREEMTGSKVEWIHGDKAMQDLKKMHKMVISNVDIVQDRTSQILQEQERDLLRAFRARLFDLQTELDREKKRKDDGAVAWIEKSRKLENELEWIEETADRLDRMNQNLMKENNHLKGQFRVQEEDRSYLVKQLVNAKRDNTMMREKMIKLEENIEQLNLELEAFSHSGATKNSDSSPSRSTTTANSNEQRLQQMKNNLQYLDNPNSKYNTNVADALIAHGDNILDTTTADNRYREVIRKLKRTLELERKHARTVREKYAQEMESRTELEAFLRSAVEDVRNQLKSMKSRSNITIDDFTAEDREKAMALLVSQEKVISLLYGKTFPARMSQVTNITTNLDTNTSMAMAGSPLPPTGSGSAQMEQPYVKAKK